MNGKLERSRERFDEALQLLRPATLTDSQWFTGTQWGKEFFSRWHWDEVFAAYLTRDNDGYALLSLKTGRSALGMPLNSIGFNESGEPGMEDITPEMNGFIGQESDRFDAEFNHLLGTLCAVSGWNEFRISTLSEHQAAAVEGAAKANRLIVFVTAKRLTYWVDLEQIRSSGKSDYLAALSANTRQQLRRARRQAEKDLGSLTLERAKDLDGAQEWLAQLAQLHLDRWSSEDGESGFTHPRFVQFHQAWLGSMWGARKDLAASDSYIELLRISAGQTVLGFLHLLICGKHVHFHMSGIRYKELEKYKPGLLCHLLAIEMYLNEGYHAYDFLPGTSRYKASLATHTQVRLNLSLRRRSPGFVIEDKLRQLKRSDRFAQLLRKIHPG